MNTNRTKDSRGLVRHLLVMSGIKVHEQISDKNLPLVFYSRMFLVYRTRLPVSEHTPRACRYTLSRIRPSVGAGEGVGGQGVKPHMGGGLPRNYEVIGDICESSFNPFVLSDEYARAVPKRADDVPMLVVASRGREIRFDDAFGQKGNRYSRSFACESSLALVRDVIYDKYTLPRNDRIL